MLGDALLGAAISFVLATVATPVGVSGAVFLVPVQVSLLHTPSPSLTPTNLLYNVVATPGALARYAGRGLARSPLARTLAIGTLPGVVVVSSVRVWRDPPPTLSDKFDAFPAASDPAAMSV